MTGVQTCALPIFSVTISGVPAGASLSAGTDNGNGTWTLTPAQLTNLKITPPANSDADFNLTVKAISTEGAGGSATTEKTLSVVVNPVADAPLITTVAATGNEDTAISLNVGVSLPDAGETLQLLQISGIPTGAILTTGTDNHTVTVTGGVATKIGRAHV